jgi:hypothetical protein
LSMEFDIALPAISSAEIQFPTMGRARDVSEFIRLAVVK